MFVYTKGYYPNNCPSCDSPIMPTEIQFDDRSIEEIVESAWSERNEYFYSYIYDGQGNLQGRFSYEISRHSCIGLVFNHIDNRRFFYEDDGNGNKVLRVE